MIKFLTWVASPIGFLCICLSGWIFFRLIRTKRSWANWLVFLGLCQLIFLSTPWVSFGIKYKLEEQAKNLMIGNNGKPYAAILLLGGGMTPAVPEIGQRADAKEAFDRVIYAAQLYNQGIASLIIASGGSQLKQDFPDSETEAESMSRVLQDFGVPESAILLEKNSLNTHGNMALTKILLKDSGISGRLALVTSADHMPRAYKSAITQGLLVDAYPTDWTSHLETRSPIKRWLPNSNALEDSERAIKEWIALLINY